jgi:hypothetical protein
MDVAEGVLSFPHLSGNPSLPYNIIEAEMYQSVNSIEELLQFIKTRQLTSFLREPFLQNHSAKL